MGFSWSSYVAQETLLRVLAEAGLREDAVISTDGLAPIDLSETFSLATDDVMIFSDRGPGGTLAATERLEKQLDAHGIAKHAAKDVTDATSAICVGVELVNGTHWWPPIPRMWDLILAIMHLVVLRKCSPSAVRARLGSLQWLDLLQRCKLSLYDTVYAFARQRDEWTVVDVPTSVLQEMVSSIILAPFWDLDMTTPHLPFIGATDASTVFGFGASIAPMSLDEIRKIARLSTKAGDHVTLSGDGNDAQASMRLGQPHQIPYTMSDFRTAIKRTA